MKYFLPAILLTIFLAGCSINPAVRTEVVKPFIPALPMRVTYEPVEWHVVLLPEIVNTANGEVTSTNRVAYFALDTKNYENLSKNTAEMTAYLQKLRVILYSLQSTNYEIRITNTSTPLFLFWK